MAIVGTLIDKTTLVTTSGAAALTTLPHSLNTTPDEIRLQLLSVNNVSITNLVAVGGNASLLTVGTVGGSGTFAYNVVATYWFSEIR